MKMNKKRNLAVIIVFCMIISLVFTGCRNDTVKWADGVYFAEDKSISDTGWRTVVTVLVVNGKITAADWNGANKDGGTDMKKRSSDGKYEMSETGEGALEWFEQATLAENYLIEEQDPTNIKYSDNSGHTDAITGVSINVSVFFTLAKKALDKGPVGYGRYIDGTYHAEAQSFSAEGWKEMIDATVISGYIVSVNWDPVNADGKHKKELSEGGTYGMVEQGGASSEWYVQANLVEDNIMKTQDLTLYKATNTNGNIDSVAGVSISVMPGIDLLKSVISLRDVIS
jgi:major membrane immunogen (membrane-anchored lipoprotein)